MGFYFRFELTSAIPTILTVFIFDETPCDNYPSFRTVIPKNKAFQKTHTVPIYCICTEYRRILRTLTENSSSHFVIHKTCLYLYNKFCNDFHGIQYYYILYLYTYFLVSRKLLFCFSFLQSIYKKNQPALKSGSITRFFQYIFENVFKNSKFTNTARSQ